MSTCVSQQVHFTPRESSIDVKLKSTVGTLLPEKERQNGDGRPKADLCFSEMVQPTKKNLDQQLAGKQYVIAVMRMVFIFPISN